MKSSTTRISPLFLAFLGLTALGGVLATFDSELAVTTGVLLLVLGGWTTSLCLHEFGHAVTAFRGGDLSVRSKGYLTLDPRRYTDPILSIVLPLIFVALGGIPLPGGAVWINHHALRSRRTESMVSLAGPLTNLVLGVLIAAAVAVVPMPLGLAAGLSYLAFLQVIAFVLNILPIPGLDGYGAIEPYLSAPARHFGEKARPWAPLVLFLLLIGVPFVGRMFFQLAYFVFGLLGGDTAMTAYGQAVFRSVFGF
ncbi:site-2 protease family protein [Saccharopolyspora hirsuta]|uniref:Site-2 protease family protein n=1 Tax=Saccharopolyspora hirsuta TaxID=1837 RepID=A0A5M7B7K9_SACHI|nr:site-2 protease family protein [Saccharopolyspora hirsuta]KAA5825342.1 site-2 protease family protein [Saccharopolyspora hirsuta]MBF6512486.1 site-2 protease family protein [Nocardia farcinica]